MCALECEFLLNCGSIDLFVVVQTTLAAKSGDVLAVFVGGGGQGALSDTGGVGGENGGGVGGRGNRAGAGGGGASSIHGLLPALLVRVRAPGGETTKCVGSLW